MKSPEPTLSMDRSPVSTTVSGASLHTKFPSSISKPDPLLFETQTLVIDSALRRRPAGQPERRVGHRQAGDVDYREAVPVGAVGIDVRQHDIRGVLDLRERAATRGANRCHAGPD